MAVQAKGRLGAILGIEDNMPAYRVIELESRTMRSIPFAQIVSHEGHYPFRNYELWNSEEKELPTSFIPTREAQLESDEWHRYKFARTHCEELGAAFEVPVWPPVSGSTPPVSASAPVIHEELVPIEESEYDPEHGASN